MSVNKAILIGNLGRDPEMRYTGNGQTVTQFSLATSRNYKKDDEWQEETEWHRVVVWGQLAERVAEQLRKGSSAYVEGRIQTRSWEDKDGQKKYTTEIIAAVVQKLDRTPKDGSEPSGGYEPASAPSRERKTGEYEDNLDDLPF